MYVHTLANNEGCVANPHVNGVGYLVRSQRPYPLNSILCSQSEIYTFYIYVDYTKKICDISYFFSFDVSMNYSA